MNKKKIIEYLSPTKTGPIVVVQTMKYSISGLFKNDVSYSFFYECNELGITWISDGTILTQGFSGCNVFKLFSKCNLDVDYLKSKQSEYEQVPNGKKELKQYLQYSYTSKIIEVNFTDEDWRRDYWFCNQANYLKFHIYAQAEERLLIQIAPAKFIMDIFMDNSATSRSYVLSAIPGKKGVYDYVTGSYMATPRIKEIADYYSQFGFFLPEGIIEQIGDFLKEGDGCTGEMHRKEEYENDEYSEDDEHSDYFDSSGIESIKMEYLAVFGLDEDAIWDDVVYARNALLKTWHPDKWMNDERRRAIAEKQIKKINNAFDELKKIFENTSDNQEKKPYSKTQENQNKQGNQEYQDSTSFEQGFAIFFDYMNGRNGKEKDEKKALEIALRYAKMGYPEACVKAGLLYLGFNGIPKDLKQSLFWLEKATCDSGKTGAYAAYQMGLLYTGINGAEVDYSKAFYWFKRSSAKGNVEATSALGVCYAYGDGVEQNFSKAVECFKSAAESGNAAAANNYARMFEKGTGVEEDREEAKHWYKKAAELGNGDAAYSLAMLIDEDEGHEEEAFKWYLYGAENCNDPSSYYVVGQYYDCGFDPVEEDQEKAFMMYKKAMQLGHEDATFEVAEHLLNGKGVAKSEEEALLVLQPLVEEKNTDACFTVGELYFERGEFEKAFPYLETVIENERETDNGYHEKSAIYLADILIKKGSKPDVDKAYQLLMDISYWSDEADEKLVEIYKRSDGSNYLEQSILYYQEGLSTEKRAYPRLAECYLLSNLYSLAFSVATECESIVVPPDEINNYENLYKFKNSAILGTCYLYGYGCSADFDKAFSLFFRLDSRCVFDPEKSDEENYAQLSEHDGRLLAKAYCEYYGKGTSVDKRNAFQNLRSDSKDKSSSTKNYSRMLLEYLGENVN